MIFTKMELRNNRQPLLSRLQRQVDSDNENIILKSKIKFEKDKKDKMKGLKENRESKVFNLLEADFDEEIILKKPTRLKVYIGRRGR